ncbi:ABC transporter permease [Pseudoclavibacter soli]|uniref:ABC transporter permease n=1 Tax=Pseudoclavibacter soli TaxID=452623 RepID=UPI000407B554|nr:ABC transporter permease [Pseudoclavibacter soli]
MNPAEIFRSALHGVTANPLRSLLTMLGVLIGVASVILLLAVGNGSASKIQDAISSLGTTTLTVRSTGQATSTLTTEISNQIANAGLGHVDKVVPQVSTSQTVIADGNSADSVSIIGTTADYFTIGTYSVESGSAFTDADVTLASKVAVIGQSVATDLFGSSRAALGSTIDIDGAAYTVTGILSTQSSTTSTDADSVVIAPLTRIQRSFTGFDDISTLTVTATDADSVDAAEGELEVMLNQLLGVSDSGSISASGASTSSSNSSSSTPYQIVNQSSLLETQAESAASFTTLLGAVAAISLLVGGIGVTNVMLVTVTERTREIGIRKAIGATKGVILAQFLTEAALLTLTGGIVGVVLAYIGSNFTINGTQPVILGWSVPLALGVSVAIGVFFGAYPAARAASLRPIQALRAT